MLMVVQVRGLTKSNTRLQSLRKRMKLKSDGVIGLEQEVGRLTASFLSSLTKHVIMNTAQATFNR